MDFEVLVEIANNDTFKKNLPINESHHTGYRFVDRRMDWQTD